MAIIFADEGKRRRNRRAAVKVFAALCVAGLAVFGVYSLTGHGDQPAESEVTQTRQNPVEAAPSLPTRVLDPKPVPVQAGSRSPNGPGSIDCEVTDGDTLKCAGRRIRLIGIDAPELPGHCRKGRNCVEGDPFAASIALQRLIKASDLQIMVRGRDRFDRELANVYADGKNVACDLIAGGFAVYVSKWDGDGTVREDCSILGL